MSRHGLFIGTSGYSYEGWKGPFYPEDTPARKMLSFYSSRLSTVEINNTFYRLPRREVLENWGAQVPDSFRFAIKASRRITHQRRLNEGSESPLRYLLENVEALGDKLGTLLFQLPPNMKLNLERLESFLAYLPDGLHAAFEFRNESWFDDTVYEALRRHNAALVLADTDDEERNPPFVRTADWGYLRLRRTSYDDGMLQRWAERLSEPGWKEAFVYFKHEDAGAGPAMAARLEEMIQ